MIGRRVGLIGLVAAVAVAWSEPARAAEGYGVSVVRAEADLIEADPGQVITVGLRVTGAPVELDEVLVLPEGWRTITPPSGFALSGSATRLVAFSVPRGTAPGAYTVRYGVVGHADPSIRDEELVRVLVHAVTGLGLAIVDQPSHALAGETVTTRVLVRNDGNAPTRVRVAAEAGEDVEVVAEPSVVELRPRESREVAIVATPSASIDRFENTPVRVTVEDTMDDASRAGLVVWVPVTPRHARRPDVMRHLPLTATASGNAGDGRFGGQLALVGAGPLDAAERFALDVELRGPDAQSAGAFGRRDELRAELSTPWGDLQVGDRAWSASPLLSPQRWGRGVGAEVRGGGVALSGHYAGSRFLAEPVREAAAGLTLGVGSPVEGSVHVLHTDRRRADGAEIDTLASARLAWTPAEDLTFAGEIGVDRAHGGGTSAGYRLDASGRKGPLAFEVLKARGGEDFHGYFEDIDLTSAGVVVPLAPRWTLQASALHRVTGLDVGPSTAAAPRDTVARVRARVQATDGLTLSFGPEASRRVDAVSDAARVLAAGGRLQVGASAGGHAAWVETAAAWHEVGAERRHVGGFEAIGNLALRPLPRQSVGVYGSWSTGFEDGPLLGRGDVIGVFLDWEPVNDLVLDLRGERGLDETGRSQIDARAVWTSPKGVEIGARGRWRVSKRQDSGSLSAEAWVSVPVGLPLGRRADVGLIRGRLADPSAGPREGVLVSVGDEVAVTDRRGRFAMAVAPGEHLLTLDPQGIGLDHVPLTPLPLPLTVGGGRVVEVAVDVAPAASLSGVLAVGDEPLSGVRVVLSDGERNHVRTTDAAGAFAFRGVAPGEWSVRVDPAGLPAWHRAEAVPALSLAAGEVRAIEVAVRPVERALRLSDPVAVALPTSEVHAAPAPADAPSPSPARGAAWTRPYDPAAILPECHDAIGCVWVAEPWWSGEAPDDAPVVADLSAALADPRWLEDHATCAP